MSIKTGGFASVARFAAAGLFAVFLIMAAAASAGTYSFRFPEFFLGAFLAVLVFFASLLSEKLSGKTAVILCALLCILPRLLLSLFTAMEMGYDFARFFNTAAAFAKGLPMPDQAYQAVFPHLLGYPAVLSLIFRLFGPSLWAAQALNIVLDTGSCLLLYYLGSKYFGRRGAVAAALLFAINPNAILHMPISCGEPLYMLLMLLTIVVFSKASASASADGGIKSLPLWILTGLAMGLFNSVRPLGLIFMIAFCIIYLLFGKLGFLKKLMPLALMAAAYLLTCCLYSVWAEKVLERPAAGGSAGWNLYLGMNTNTQGRWNAADNEQMSGKLVQGRSAPEIQSDFMGMALERLKANIGSGDISRLLAGKFKSMWGRDNSMIYWLRELEDRGGAPRQWDFKLDISKQNNKLETLCGAFWWGLLLLCAPAAYFMFRRPEIPGVVLTCVVALAGVILALLVLEMNARYHYPADALLALAAAWGCGQLPEGFRWPGAAKK